jgi:hypothetical protein
MFDGFDLTGCVRVDVVSTLLGGTPSSVVEAILRVHHVDGSSRDVAVTFGPGAPIRETLDAHVRALNAYLARVRQA